jgi:hypothetical protein
MAYIPATNQPDGQITSTIKNRVQPLLKKYFPVAVGQITLMTPPSRSTKGRLAIVVDAGRDAVDAAAFLTNQAKAYGEIVLSCHPDAGVKFAGR